MLRIRPVVCLVFVAALFASLSGCSPATQGVVYVDNASEETISVEVDGVESCQIEPGEFEKVVLDFGDRQIRVKRDGEVIYDQTHTLEPLENTYARPTYMLNPDNSVRYCKVSLLWGDDSSSGPGSDGQVSLVSNIASNNTGEEMDEAERQERIEGRYRRTLFQTLKGRMDAYGNEPFFQFQDPDFLLEPLPHTISSSNRFGNLLRSTLIRVPQELHDAVEEALQITEPTEENVEYLRDLIDTLDSWAPMQN